MGTVYVIRSRIEKDDETGRPLFWSNDDGWVFLADATQFTREDSKHLNLPSGKDGSCEWIPIGERD